MQCKVDIPETIKLMGLIQSRIVEDCVLRIDSYQRANRQDSAVGKR